MPLNCVKRRFVVDSVYGTNYKNNATKTTDDEEYARLMCSVPGCQNRWSVHLDGDKPKCSRHQWAKNSSDYTKPTVSQSVSRTIRHWNETENDGEVF